MGEIEYKMTQVHDVSAEVICDIMSMAFKGAIHGWCSGVKPLQIISSSAKPWFRDPRVWENEFMISFSIKDMNSEILGPQKLNAALSMLPDTCIEEIAMGDYDEETVDILVQLALFGRIMYHRPIE